MEKSSVVGPRKLRPSKAVYVQLLFGAIFGLIFAFLSDMIPHPEETEVITRLGWRKGVDLTWGGYFTISFAALWSGMALLQALGLVVCYFNPWFGAKTGVVQMFGGGKQGRLTLWPLAISWFGHAALTALLLVTTLWQVKGTLAWVCLLAGVGLIIVIALSTLQFLRTLDELIKAIWIEGLALSCSLLFLSGSLFSLAHHLDLIGGLTGLQVLTLFNWLYLFTYMGIMWVRAPEMLVSPNLDDT